MKSAWTPLLTIAHLVEKMPAIVHLDDLTETWSKLASELKLDSSHGMEPIIAVPRDLTLRQENLADSAWGGAWEWNLSEAATRAALVSTLLAAALTAAGVGTGLAPILIPTVLPLIFDFKRVRIERVADHYLQIIGIRKDLADRVGTLDQLYGSLPDQIRSEISKQELLEFLGLAAEAGHAHDRDGVFEVLPNGETCFRLRIR